MQDEQSNQNASPKPRRSWKRFSIRTLLVMTALVAVLLARWSIQRLDREIEEIVLKHGGYVGYDFGEGNWEGFREWCASLHLAKGNMFIEISVSNMTSFERAELFDRLGRRGDVQGIAVHNADDEVLWAIGETLTGITELHVDGREVMDHGLVYLRRLSNLEALYLDTTAISGHGFSSLRGMSNLEYLEITSSRMTDDGVAELIQFPNLWHVKLDSNDRLTNATVHHLGRMKALAHVNLIGTSITNEEMAKLWTLLPKLNRLNGLKRPSVSSDATSGQLLGESVEALTTLVLAHELSHAYTHLGADIDGHRWATEDFLATDNSLLECLAQYYTHRVLKRSEWDDAFGVYQRLLERQPPNYGEHLPLVRDSKPEEVRAAMLKVRRQGHRRLVAMKRLLAEERDALRTEVVTSS